MSENIRDIFNRISQIPGAEKGGADDFLRISLPVAANSDYYFSVFLYKDGDPQISATYSKNSDCYFWYHPFEIYDFDSQEDRINAFNKTVENLFINPTRIIQKKGLISWSFSCFYFKNNEWIKVYSHSGLRIANTPPINAKEIIYQSPIVVSKI